MEKLEDHNQQDLMTEPDIDQHAQVNLEFQQLLNLNTELRTANNDLYASVEQLKTELAEAEKILQWQKTRSSVTESMFKQQSQELSAANEQIKSLYQQLEIYAVTIQRQELSIESYKSLMEISQQRLARLERECSLLKSNYSQESQQLLQWENTCRELQTRLMRQQRQTLQFKSALEKCLDTPIPNSENYLEDHVHHPYNVIHEHTRFSRKARSLFPNAHPIPPWSAVTDPQNDSIHDPWTPPTTNISDCDTHQQEPFISESITDNMEMETLATSQILPEIPPQDDITLELFTNPLPEAISQATAKEINVHDPDEDDTLIWKNLVLDLENNPLPQITIKQDVELEINPLAIDENKNNLLLSPAPELPMISTEVEMEDYWLDVTDDPLDDHTSEHKSPSPLIYPQRPPKGRKSLASVELPNFRPPNQ